MKVRDTRHHSETREQDEASSLIKELADRAYMPSCKFDCKDTAHYHAKPGAFIERLPEISRKILRKLESK